MLSFSKLAFGAVLAGGLVLAASVADSQVTVGIGVSGGARLARFCSWNPGNWRCRGWFGTPAWNRWNWNRRAWGWYGRPTAWQRRRW